MTNNKQTSTSNQNTSDSKTSYNKMEKKPRQKRSRAESCAYSSPSTFVSSDFHIRPTGAVTVTGTSTENSKADAENQFADLIPERDLWNQVLNIRQIVSRMQGNLNDLQHTNHAAADYSADLQDLNSFDLSKELDSFSGEDDSWDTADEVINLEGILVHVSSSDSSSSQHIHHYPQHHQIADDASEAADSCVSSLGLGGHETTTPIHFSSHYSKSIARGNLVSQVQMDSQEKKGSAPVATAATTPSRSLERQDDSDSMDSSVESLTTWEELLHVFRILYFFVLEFPTHFYSFLRDYCKLSSTTKTAYTTAAASRSRRDRRRFVLYSLLTLFIIGCVAWKQCPSCFTTSRSTPNEMVSQSCVTPLQTNATRVDLESKTPLFSVTTKSMGPSHSLGMTSPPLPPNEVLDAMKASNTTFPAEEEFKLQEQEEEVLPSPMKKIVDRLQNQGKKLVHKLAKNNHKMWNQYPTPVSNKPAPQVHDEEPKQVPAAIKLVQEKGQEVFRKLVKNNAKMWDNYPTIGGSSSVKPNEKPYRRGLNGFFQKTANMWNDKPSDYFLRD